MANSFGSCVRSRTRSTSGHGEDPAPVPGSFLAEVNSVVVVGQAVVDYLANVALQMENAGGGRRVSDNRLRFALLAW